MHPRKGVVYLGDLPPVAEALAGSPHCRLLACAVEEGDDPATVSRIQGICARAGAVLIRVTSEPQLCQRLSATGPIDLGILANFGIILRSRTLTLPREGFINAHLGLLPDYPGRNPIRDALRNGEKVTGVTLHRATETPDRGPILSIRHLSAEAKRGPAELFERLSALAASMVLAHLSETPSSH